MIKHGGRPSEAAEEAGTPFPPAPQPPRTPADLTALIENGLRQLTHGGSGSAFGEDGQRLARILTEIASQLGKHDARLNVVQGTLGEKPRQPTRGTEASSDELDEVKATLEDMEGRLQRAEAAAKAAERRAEAAEAATQAATRLIEYVQDQASEATKRAARLGDLMETNSGDCPARSFAPLLHPGARTASPVSICLSIPTPP